MSAPTILDECTGPLSNAEERLVAVLRENMTQGAFFTATELAGRAKVHPSTVVRFAQRLGFKGFLQLRERLRADILNSEQAKYRVERRLAGLEKSRILHSLVESEIASLQKLQRNDLQRPLDTAAESIVTADQVFLFGPAHATSLIELLDRRFRRYGVRTVVLGSKGREIAERINNISKNDVLLGLVLTSDDTIPPGVKPLIKHTKTQKATSIVISDHIGPSLKPRPDLLLSASRGEHDQLKTLTVPMALCNALALLVSHKRGEKWVVDRDRVNALARSIDGDEGEQQTAINRTNKPTGKETRSKDRKKTRLNGRSRAGGRARA